MPIDLKKQMEENNRAASKDNSLSGKKKPLIPITKVSVFIFIFIFTSLVVFSSQVLVTGQSSTSWFSKLPIISHLKHLAESADKQLKGEDRDRINILLLGMGGKKHEGSYLTDTIMLASFEPSSGKVALVSIPRDTVVPLEDLGWKKINNINAYAEVQNPGSGGIAVSQALSDMLDLPIDYYIRVDFIAFTNIVNELGGVNVYVENTLDDYSYPIMGRETAEPYESRFEHLHIDQGWQEMDGELALKYARSRHALGVEGSDFARAKRQQNIIQAVKDKALNQNFFSKSKTIVDIIDELQDHVSTNLKVWEMLKLWNEFKDITSDKIINKVLDNSPNSLLVDTISEDGAYILLPRSGDFSEIQYFVHNIFSDVPIVDKTKVVQDMASIEVRNGTWINGLASRVAVDLEKYGFTVVRIGNSSRQNFQKSVIYDLTYGEKMESLEILKDKTGANISFGLPQWLIDDIATELTNEQNPEQPDFILVLGQDADSSESGTVNLSE